MTTIKMRESFLEIEEPIQIVDNIKYVKYVDYRPDDSSLNEGGQIRITMQDIDGFCLLEKSQFIITVDVQKDDDERYAAADLITLANNGIMYLFNEVCFEINNKIVEQYSNVGHSTTILNLLKNNYGFSKSAGLSQCWSIDEGTTSVAADTNSGFKLRRSMLQNTPIGASEFTIPFNNIFGFHGKIMNGLKTMVTFNRVINLEPLLGAAAAAAGKCTIKSLVWRIPYIQPKLAEEARLYSLLAKQVEIPFGFLTNKMRSIAVPAATDFTWNVGTDSDKIEGIVLFFQTTSRVPQTENPSVFSNVGLKNARVLLNKEVYPGVDLKTNFTTGNYSFLYKMFLEFRRKHYGDGLPEITPLEFKNLYPMVVFDVGNQQERSTANVVSIEIEASFGAACPANTTAYALIIYNKMFTMKADGERRMGMIVN